MATAPHVCGTGTWTGPVAGDPDNNVTLSAVAVFGGIDVNWTVPTINPHAVAHVRLYRGTTPDRNLAVLRTTQNATLFQDRQDIFLGVTYYYWIRIISVHGTEGDWIGPASAMGRALASDLLDELEGKVTLSAFATSLQTEIGRIDTLAGNLQQEVLDRQTGQTSFVEALEAVDAGVADAMTFIGNVQSSLTTDVGAVAAQLDATAVTLGSQVAAVETLALAAANEIDGVQANYTIKVQARSDGKRAIAGIGLNATTDGMTSQSEIILMADKVQFVASAANINDTPQVLLQSGLVNGINTLIVPATRLGDGSIGSRLVVDGSIETRHLKVIGAQGQALNADPFCEDPSAWVPDPGRSFRYGTSDPGFVAQTFVQCGAGDGTDRWLRTLKEFPVSINKVYSLTASLYAFTGNNRNMYIFVDFYDSTGTRVSTAWGGSFSGYVYGAQPPVGQWTRQGGQFGAGTARPIPAAARTMRIGVWFQYSGAGTSSVAQAATDIRVSECIDSALVVQGGITADRITAASLSALSANLGSVVVSSGNLRSGNFNGAIATDGTLTDAGTQGWALAGDGKLVVDAALIRHAKSSSSTKRWGTHTGPLAVDTVDATHKYAYLPTKGFVVQTSMYGHVDAYINLTEFRILELTLTPEAYDNVAGTVIRTAPSQVMTFLTSNAVLADDGTMRISAPFSLSWLYSGSYYSQPRALPPGTSGTLPGPSLISNHLPAGQYYFRLRVQGKLYFPGSTTLTANLVNVHTSVHGYAVELPGSLGDTASPLDSPYV